MRAYRIFYAVMFLQIGYLFMHYPVPEYMVAFFLLFFLPWISGLGLRFGMRDMEIQIRTEPCAKPGDFREIRISVRGSGKICVGRIRAEVELKNRFTGETERHKADLSADRKGFCGSFGHTYRACGYVEVRIRRLCCIDWFGIGARRRGTDAGTQVLVCPEPSDPERSIPIPAGSHAGVNGQIRGPREYVRGDPLNRIHWKLSAKMGTLLVKEYEEEVPSRIFLLLDFRCRQAECCNLAVARLLFVSRQLLLQDKAHWIGLSGEGELKRFYVKRPETYPAVLSALLRVPFDCGPERTKHCQELLSEEGMQVILISGGKEEVHPSVQFRAFSKDLMQIIRKV